MKKNGLTLIELVVVLGLSMLFLGSGMVYLNRFNARSRVEGARSELSAWLRLARNMAMTKQGAGTDELNYVRVELTSSGVLTAWPVTNVGEGTSLLSREISEEEVAATTLGATDLWFAARTGKLTSSTGPVAVDQVVTVSLSSGEGIGETMVITINASGLINGK